MAPESGPGRVAIVDAATKRHAHHKAIDLKLKRHGDQVLAIKIPDGEPELSLPRDRILRPEELEAIGAESLNGVPDALYDLIVAKEVVGD